jgi:hypothetical protein
MTVTDPKPASSSPLVNRAKAILLTPAPEWEKIDAEPATVQGLYTGYICVLAAIPAVAGFVGRLWFHPSFGAFSFGGSIVGNLVASIVGYVLALAMVFVVALVIDALAPSFGGEKNQIQAMKVAAYANTASWVAGVLLMFPPLAPLVGLAGLYGLYLLYLGMPKLMKAPQDKALAYTAITCVAVVVLFIVVAAVSASMAGAALLGGIG